MNEETLNPNLFEDSEELENFDLQSDYSDILEISGYYQDTFNNDYY